MAWTEETLKQQSDEALINLHGVTKLVRILDKARQILKERGVAGYNET